MANMEEIEAIKKARLLMVGAGGIGCELLKTLVMTGFEDIELIDLDTIDVSNLNRQFLFRKRHVGQSKAKVAREAVLKFRPNAKITAHHGNVKSPDFGVEFIQTFDVVLSGLDNLDARRHVNRICLAAGVPLVESGTTGYNGQVDVHLKGLTECYECKPKPVPKSYPTCTITNTPSKPVHCIVWAKELPFQKLFGDQGQVSDLDILTDDMDKAAEEEEQTFFRHRPDGSATHFARRIFDRIFGLNVARTLEMDDLWANRTKPTPLYIDDVLPVAEMSEMAEGTGNLPGDMRGVYGAVLAGTGDAAAELAGTGNGEMAAGQAEPVAELASAANVKTPAGIALSTAELAGAGNGGGAVEIPSNGNCTKNDERIGSIGAMDLSVSALNKLGLTNPQEVWSLKDNARVFLESIKLFLETRSKEFGSLAFDKDDQLAVEFVTAASNLRSHSFGIPLQSLFDAKGIAGNIIHAIATTNAIVAGLIVVETIKVITKKFDKCRNVWCNEFPMGRGLLVMPEEPHPPNPKCYVCAETPLMLEVNTSTATFGEIMEKIVWKRLSVASPMVMFGNNLLYETGDDLEEDEIQRYEGNLKKKLADYPVPISNGAVLAVEDYQQHFKCSLHIKHRDDFDEEKEPEGMVLHGEVPSNGAAETERGILEVEAGEDDFAVIEAGPAAPGKRKRRGADEEGGETGEAMEKKAKVAVVDDLRGKYIVL